jgi:methylase of polypeptide subunit release factors
MATTENTAEALWKSLTNRRAELSDRERAAYNLAEQNAGDTSVERSFALFSQDWYEVFASSYDYLLDTVTDADIESWNF